MALVKCRECLKQISTAALTCPHCGAPGYAAGSPPPRPAPKAPPTPTWLVVSAVGAVVVFGAFFAGKRAWDAHQKQAALDANKARIERMKQDRVDQFARLRPALQAEARNDLADRRYLEVIGDLEKWGDIMDPETRKLYQAAMDATAADRAAKEEVVRQAAAKAAEEKRKAEASAQAKVRELEGRIGKQPVASAWDGVYPEVERYLEKNLHDPDSLDFTGCTGLVESEKGWVTRCEYRAKNAFGALRIQNTLFVIKHGQVVSAANL